MITLVLHLKGKCLGKEASGGGGRCTGVAVPLRVVPSPTGCI